MKPGYTTTEFWITLGLGVVAILKLTGIVGDEVDESQVAAGITSVVMAVGVAVVAATYIWSRARVKVAALKR